MIIVYLSGNETSDWDGVKIPENLTQIKFIIIIRSQYFIQETVEQS